MVDAARGLAVERGLAERDQVAGQRVGPGGLAVLVVDHVEGVAQGGQFQHGGDEVVPVLAVQPCAADDVAVLRQHLGHGLLADQLGAPVGVDRAGRGVLGVRLRGVAGQHVVGGDVEQARTGGGAGLREDAYGCAVDGRCGFLGGLGAVHVRPGGAVDDHRDVLDGGADRGRVGDVEVRAPEADGLDAGVLERGQDVLAEHPGGAGDEPAPCGGVPGVRAHFCRAAFAFSGSHQARFSRYQSMVALMPSSKVTCGA